MTESYDRKKVYLLFDKKKYKKALYLINLELEKNPNSFDALSDKVGALGLLCCYNDAIQVADNALGIEDNKFLHYKKGVSLYFLNKFEEAIMSFDKCIEAIPDELTILALKKKISALIFLGRHKEAIEIFETNDLPESNSSIFINNLGYSFLQLHEFEKSENYLK